MKHFYILIFTSLLLFAVSTQGQTSEWPLDVLDAARNVEYLSSEEKDLILEINKIRHDPARYARENMLFLGSFYSGKQLLIPGKDPVYTIEGKNAYTECMEELGTAKPVPPLRPSRGMTKACRLLVYDQSLTGKTGHKGSGNSSPYERMQSFGRFIGKSAENIHYGDCETRYVIISMLISDGTKSRSSRKNILDPDFQLVGAAVGTHKTTGNMSAINFASTYTDKH
jgi:hypothetical protein